MTSPFGIAPFSTPSLGIAKYFVSFESVPKPHPDLKSYSGFWEPGKGIVKITGRSATFEDDGYATDARRLYDKMKRQLTGVYGNPEVREYVFDEVWEDEKDFCMSIEQGERSHTCSWSRSNSDLPDAIEEIWLTIASEDGYEQSYVMLAYQFVGADDGTAGDDLGLDSL